MGVEVTVKIINSIFLVSPPPYFSLVNQAVRSIKLTFNIIFSFPSFLTFLFFLPVWRHSIIYFEKPSCPSGGCSVVSIRLLYCLLGEDPSKQQQATHHGVKACLWQERNFTELDMLDQSITFATNRSLILFSLNVKQKETVGMLIRGKETFCLLPMGCGKSPIFDQIHIPLLNIKILCTLSFKPMDFFLKTE